ncbi:MAG: tRNA pseudouridine(55) synthase TruB [Candidatus Gracilibacteria bacterium]|nr:tRNA pseudouridine(55) synthase TruB [Candidatus Gracilibacteria bacterium]
MFYLLNKPSGISSFQAIAKLRKILNIRKVGHTGTLDPLATGLLLVATGNSTKLIPYLEKAHKTYVFSFNLDGFTETGDLGSDIRYLPENLVEKIGAKMTESDIIRLIEEKFSGKISQIPPKYSAISIDGQRAYKLARDGKDVVIPERIIEIFGYKLLEFNFPKITLEMTVSAGTYIRTIAEDIGKSLGLNAYTTMLHRSKLGELDESGSYSLVLSSGEGGNEVQKSELIEIGYEKLFPDFGKITFDPENVDKISRGFIIKNTFGLTEGRKYFILDKNGKYISLIEIENNILKILSNKID